MGFRGINPGKWLDAAGITVNWDQQTTNRGLSARCPWSPDTAGAPVRFGAAGTYPAGESQCFRVRCRGRSMSGRTSVPVRDGLSSLRSTAAGGPAHAEATPRPRLPNVSSKTWPLLSPAGVLFSPPSRAENTNPKRPIRSYRKCPKIVYVSHVFAEMPARHSTESLSLKPSAASRIPPTIPSRKNPIIPIRRTQTFHVA